MPFAVRQKENILEITSDKLKIGKTYKINRNINKR